jgi:hypothetical protein
MMATGWRGVSLKRFPPVFAPDALIKRAMVHQDHGFHRGTHAVASAGMSARGFKL